jgi:PPK2 family polyphosphate:nucleotide phosphotransferase
MDLERTLRVEPGHHAHLHRLDTDTKFGPGDKAAGEALLADRRARLAELAQVLWADNRYAVLVVLQGMDTAGKDGTVKHVFSAVNPLGLRVTSFKRPTEEELEHDYLWRIHKECPRRGEIAVFNRSHYEDVGVVRVHGLVPREAWSARFEQINAFEKHLHACGTRVVKCFLHISRGEQKKRLEERLRDPLKGWKMELGDLDERRRWDDYMEAYSDAITKCSTPWAPWYVIPADVKWARNLAVADILVRVLESMDLRIPKPKFDGASIRVPD